MKIGVLFFIAFAVAGIGAQVSLDAKETANLVKVGEVYSRDVNLRGADVASSLNEHRSTKLERLIDTLLAINKGDGSILEERFLKRPSDEELYLWYALREIHYNRTNKEKEPRPNAEVAKETLSKKIDRRWLVDNYYFRIRSGIGMHFNEADLSKTDLRIEQLGLKDNTEKAIFFFNVMQALGGGRFLVLQSVGNFQRIRDFTKRFPTFDGKPYFEFTAFDYEDFDWIGYEKVESYNSRHLDTYYATLIGHYRAEAEAGDKARADMIRKRSILNEPKYFRFSSNASLLQSIFDSAK